MLKKTLHLLILAVIILSSLPVSAKIMLKPKGESSYNLTTKAIKADVQITGQFVSTTQILTFQNESGYRMEADFIYTLPKGAVATYFAYWAGDEKVVARIVEKERAAEIYRTITTRQHDPALVEMIDKNTFRARIFPVMPNADLKVEIRIVQVLPSSQNGSTYTLPLVSEDKEDQESLDNIDVKIDVKPDSNITDVCNNFGVSMQNDANGYHFALSGTNYRPEKDLNIQIKRKPAQLISSLYAAPSGGANGFFAIALIPKHSVSNPKISISGVKTFDVVPNKLFNVKANEVLTVFGRYKVSGKAKVTLSGKCAGAPVSYSSDVQFGSTPVQDNLASKLWAAEMIDQLSGSAKNRKQVISLCKRFTLPSKYASWLAVPKAEMELYKREKLIAKMCSTSKQLGQLVKAGKESSSNASKLRSQLTQQYEDFTSTTGDRFQYQAEEILCGMQEALTDVIIANKQNGVSGNLLQNQIKGLSKLAKWNPKEFLNNAAYNAATDVKTRIVDNIASGKENSKNTRELRDQLNQICKMNSEISFDYLGYYPREKMEKLCNNLADLEAKGLNSSAKKQTLKRSITSLGKYTAESPEQAIKNARLYRMESLSYDYVYEQDQDHPSKKQLNYLHKQIDRLAKLSNTTVQSQIDHAREHMYYRWGDPLIAIQAPADAQQVIAVMPDGEIKVLTYNSNSKQWEARFDIPACASEGDYVIKIVVVLKDGTRKTLTMHYSVDLTEPRGEAKAQMVTPEHKLRLELNADEDTARVSAILPWGDRIDLDKTNEPNKFFGVTSVPTEYQNSAVQVQFVLTDKAHNRNSILIDMAEH